MVVIEWSLACSLSKNTLPTIGIETKMNDTLHNKFVASSNKSTYGAFHLSTSKRRKNVSYNSQEEYILEIEKQLMRKHRLGYSGLHKFLVLKEGQHQFSHPYV